MFVPVLKKCFGVLLISTDIEIGSWTKKTGSSSSQNMIYYSAPSERMGAAKPLLGDIISMQENFSYWYTDEKLFVKEKVLFINTSLHYSIMRIFREDTDSEGVLCDCNIDVHCKGALYTSTSEQIESSIVEEVIKTVVEWNNCISRYYKSLQTRNKANEIYTDIQNKRKILHQIKLEISRNREALQKSKIYVQGRNGKYMGELLDYTQLFTLKQKQEEAKYTRKANASDKRLEDISKEISYLTIKNVSIRGIFKNWDKLTTLILFLFSWPMVIRSFWNRFGRSAIISIMKILDYFFSQSNEMD
eukprot:TRINITY_DN4104_c2_g1_i2.p1 TRINITY_DN4104_c2_g1~~TRINITY_DN4104_c2_g1_i2.p1  ORF type:complete len:303 (+),score=45.65 TRINITY_DN4104_c2_g1_i2:231-1139(+)